MQQRSKDSNPTRGGDSMFEEMMKRWLLEDSNSPSPREIQRPQRKLDHKEGIPAFAWKNRILEVSQKQGYTSVAL